MASNAVSRAATRSASASRSKLSSGKGNQHVRWPLLSTASPDSPAVENAHAPSSDEPHVHGLLSDEARLREFAAGPLEVRRRVVRPRSGRDQVDFDERTARPVLPREDRRSPDDREFFEGKRLSGHAAER